MKIQIIDGVFAEGFNILKHKTTIITEILGKKKYSELIKEEKKNPQLIFNKTHKCPKCGYCHVERWVKIGDEEFEDDRR